MRNSSSIHIHSSTDTLPAVRHVAERASGQNMNDVPSPFQLDNTKEGRDSEEECNSSYHSMAGLAEGAKWWKTWLELEEHFGFDQNSSQLDPTWAKWVAEWSNLEKVEIQAWVGNTVWPGLNTRKRGRGLAYHNFKISWGSMPQRPVLTRSRKPPSHNTSVFRGPKQTCW